LSFPGLVPLSPLSHPRAGYLCAITSFYLWGNTWWRIRAVFPGLVPLSPLSHPRAGYLCAITSFYLWGNTWWRIRAVIN